MSPSLTLLMMAIAGVGALGCHGAGTSAAETRGSGAAARVFLVPPHDFRADEPVVVTAVLANAGTVRLSYADSNLLLNWRWRVTDSRGVLLSDQGRVPTTAEPNIRMELPPGAAVVASFDLRQLFDLPRGHYRVSVERGASHPGDPQPIRARSPEFDFDVVN